MVIGSNPIVSANYIGTLRKDKAWSYDCALFYYMEKEKDVELNGRIKIFSTDDNITADNVVERVNEALAFHMINLRAEDYLFRYRRGIQPILWRTKKVRPDICNKVVINTAEQVCVFKDGYFLTKPAFYVSRRDDEDITDKVKELNEYLYVSGKNYVDNLTVDWFHTVGIAAIFVEPNDDDDVPYKVHSLDPRQSFVVYSMRPGNEPILGVNVVIANGELIIDAWTRDSKYTLRGGGVGSFDTPRIPYIANAISVINVEPNVLGEIPIIEYIYKNNRMSAFEAAIPMMDTMNLLESNRIDGVEQFIQSLFVGVNIQLPEGEDSNSIRERGMIIFDSVGENKAEIKLISQELNQTQTQVTMDSLYEQILEKCGVPSTVGRDYGSTSDNVGAVYLRNGWAVADTDARNATDNFLESNKLFDRIMLTILKRKKADKFGKLKTNDFELRIERNDMNNLLVKTQAAINMRDLGLAPQIWLERSGLSNDPLKDIELSKEYMENNEPADGGDVVMGGQKSGTYNGGENDSSGGGDNGRGEGQYVRGYWR